jgi:hypothetical protein
MNEYTNKKNGEEKKGSHSKSCFSFLSMHSRKRQKRKKKTRHGTEEEFLGKTNKKPKLDTSPTNNNNKDKSENDDEENDGWEEIIKENSTFEEYYKVSSYTSGYLFSSTNNSLRFNFLI